MPKYELHANGHWTDSKGFRNHTSSKIGEGKYDDMTAAEKGFEWLRAYSRNYLMVVAGFDSVDFTIFERK